MNELENLRLTVQRTGERSKLEDTAGTGVASPAISYAMTRSQASQGQENVNTNEQEQDVLESGVQAVIEPPYRLSGGGGVAEDSEVDLGE